MTEAEAIARLKDHFKIHDDGRPTPKLDEAVGMAINALEKHIAKKPRFYAHNYYCTECGNLVGNNEFKWQRFMYCDKCGQKLDWGGMRNEESR